MAIETWGMNSEGWRIHHNYNSTGEIKLVGELPTKKTNKTITAQYTSKSGDVKMVQVIGTITKDDYDKGVKKVDLFEGRAYAEDYGYEKTSVIFALLSVSFLFFSIDLSRYLLDKEGYFKNCLPIPEEENLAHGFKQDVIDLVKELLGFTRRLRARVLS